MASDTARAGATLASGLALVLGGGLFVLAWQAGLWASAAGALLVILWIAGASGWAALHRPAAATRTTTDLLDPLSVRLLLDQIPVPLVRLDDEGARAINRAARRVFATDERILPCPAAFADREARRLTHEGRHWRIDAVEGATGHRLLALVDVEAEERAAQDRAADEMIDILGHELLNGLSPVVSLADSAVTAAAANDPSLPDILATLARRIEGLEGFTRGYRALARLPEPVRAPVALGELADDLARLFAARFPDVALSVDAADGDVAIDRDQMTQALWALLQNGAEAAGPGGRVSLALAADGDMLTARVGDSGAGIAPGDRARIFRPFHTTKPNGSGIGLSLARRIARSHDGEVTLDERIATTFRLQVPLRQTSGRSRVAQGNEPGSLVIPSATDGRVPRS